MRGIRKQAQHDTLNMQRHALVGEIVTDFQVGDRVMTVDNLPGKIAEIEFGPYQSTEDYRVVLDNGMGGGSYNLGQLRRLSETTAAVVQAAEVYASIPIEAVTEHTAAEDYPEMGNILYDRLPNENIRVTAANNTDKDDTDDDDSEKLEQDHFDPDDDKLPGDDVDDPAAQEPDLESAQSNVPNVTPPSACSFCGGTEFEDPQMTGRGTRIRCSQCKGTMKSWGGEWAKDDPTSLQTGPQQAQSQWEPEFPNSSQNDASEEGDYRSGGVGGVVQAPGANFKSSFLIDWAIDKIYDRIQEKVDEARRGGKDWADPRYNPYIQGPAQYPIVSTGSLDDGDFGFHLTATWMDVQAKARKIRSDGHVRVIAANKTYSSGEVQGDTATYETQLNYVPGTKKVADWACGCKWASYSWGRSKNFRRFEGRLCSHALALQYEVGARGMFGKDVSLNTSDPGREITVKWDKSDQKNLNRTSAIRVNGVLLDHTGDEWDIHDGGAAFHHGEIPSGGGVDAYHDDGHHIGEMTYHLEPHGDGGGSIHVDGPHLDPGHEYHGQAMMEHLDRHLQDRGVGEGWTYADKPTHHSRYATLLDSDGVYPFPGLLDLEHPPIYAYAANMIDNDESIANIVKMLASLGADREVARQVVKDACADLPLNGPEMAVEPRLGSSSVNETLFDENMQKRDLSDHDKEPDSEHQTDGKKHKKHRTNDAREHATHWGWGYPNGGIGLGLITCPQCQGSGCGHCAGTGQVSGSEEHDLTEAPTDSTPDETPDSGPDITGDGVSTGGTTGSIHTADYSSADPLVGIQDQNYYAPTPHSHSQNPASTGWASSQDPGDWGNSLISNNFGVTFDASLHTAVEASDAFDYGHVAGYDYADRLHDHRDGGISLHPGDYHEERNHHMNSWINRDHREHVGEGFDHGFDTFSNEHESGLPHRGGAVTSAPTVSGVALKAADTGRVLMIQRSNNDEKDPARGTWEFPGGHHEDGDLTSLHAGIREWQEEVGQPFPAGGHVSHTWRSGPYQGHVVIIPSESHIDFSKGRSESNPDDPDNDDHEQAAWWDPDHASKNPALRSELKKANPFGEIKKSSALSAPCETPGAQYSTHINGDTAEISVKLPFDMPLNTAADADHLESHMHNAMEEILAPYFVNDPRVKHADLELHRRPLERQNEMNERKIRENIEEDPDEMSVEAVLSVYTTLDDTPQAALPSTDGIVDDTTGFAMGEHQTDDYDSIPAGDSVDGPHVSSGDEESIRMAFLKSAGGQALLADAPPELQSKVAMKDFSASEQRELIEEGRGDRARNFDDLKIAGTHYELIPEDDDSSSILWT